MAKPTQTTGGSPQAQHCWPALIRASSFAQPSMFCGCFSLNLSTQFL